MSTEIVLYGVAGDPNNEIAKKRVDNLPGVDVSMKFCPPSVRSFFRVPFLQDESGSRHFGVAGVDSFVDKRLKSAGF